MVLLIGKDLSLPTPDSAELRELLSNRVTRAQYEVLYTATGDMDIDQLKAALPEFANQTHFDRRLRAIDAPFVLERKRIGGRTLYRLGGVRPHEQAARVSKTTRARILYRDGARCQMCGASPEKDPNVQLHIDHKIPQHWGGGSDDDNLWTLCSTCNEGKKSFFASADGHAPEIKAAINYPEVHRRLGELLRAFGVGAEVPSYLLAMVASAQAFQEDWHRRLRELRDLGWDYQVKKRKEGGRIVSYYILTKDGGWPSGPIRDHIR